MYPVIPIIIYNGKEKWKEKTEFANHFIVYTDEIKKYIPNFKYILIDITRFGDELLENLKDAVSYFFLLDKAGFRIIGFLKELREKDPEIFNLLGRYISGLLKYKGVEINTINDYFSLTPIIIPLKQALCRLLAYTSLILVIEVKVCWLRVLMN